MRVEARAKINWTLDITGQREDGYHLLDMLMQPITLSDTVTLEPSDALTLTVAGNPLIPADERNLAYRAAAALKEATGYSGGAAIHVEKRIPAGAGMGGGSADAAAVLAGLNRLWSLGLTQAELERIGLSLGADVPFCLRGGLTRTTGIGEEMRAIPCGRDYELLVVLPSSGLSTREVFQAYHEQGKVKRPDTDAAERALAAGRLPQLIRCLGNVLQPVSEAMEPDIREAVACLLRNGAAAASMTGSGVAVFGVYDDPRRRDLACEGLQWLWPVVWRCRTCEESLIISA